MYALAGAKDIVTKIEAGGEGPTMRLARATQSTGPRAPEAEWRRWLHEEAGAIPTLEAARPFGGAPDL